MIEKRKAEGLSFSVMVMAILALVVLIVLIAIFTQSSGKSVKVFEDCKARGGECKSVALGCLDNEIKVSVAECAEKNTVCCISISDPEKK
ncbi:hypothetical protein HYU09_03255 [Candidatus Woesearchaeota archaeon]|nr:hypothetical protein [Candidatus Woesearchaeota archaeon]